MKKYGIATVENYGSSANSLWSLDSDIDISIKLVHTKSQKHNKKGKKGNKKENEEDNKQSNIEAEFKRLDTPKCLKDIRNILRPLASQGQIDGIFGARVPLLKFTHYKTDIE